MLKTRCRINVQFDASVVFSQDIKDEHTLLDEGTTSASNTVSVNVRAY